MTTSVTTVTRTMTMRRLAELFETYDYNSIPVVEQDKLVGIVTKFDFLRAFAFTTDQMVPHYDSIMERPVAQIMTEAIIQVDPSTPLTRVLQLMVEFKTRSLPVVADQKLLGIISREDVLRALKDSTQAKP